MSPPRIATPPVHGVRAASLCVASGKGGTGKSVVAAGLASLFATRGRTLIVDADLGVGNAHILHDVHPAQSFADVVAGRATVREVVVRCGDALDLVGAGSGLSHLAALSASEMAQIADGLCALDGEYEFELVDCAAGISDQTVSFVAACDAVVVVTTPDATAMTDAYALLKVLYARRPEGAAFLVVNREVEPGEGERAAERIEQVSRKFLGRAPRFLGSLPDDRAVVRAVAARRPVVVAEPESPAAVALARLAELVRTELAALAHEGFGRRLALDTERSVRRE